MPTLTNLFHQSKYLVARILEKQVFKILGKEVFKVSLS